MDPTGSITGNLTTSVLMPTGGVRSLLIFQLGQRAYALDITNVIQIIPMMKLTPLPKTDASFEGVANIHGQLVPVIQPRQCLGMDPLELDLYTPIILTRSGEQVMGLIVDQVSGVASLRLEQIIHPEKVLPEGLSAPEILRGMVTLSGQMVLLIEPALLLDDRQVQLLCEAMQALGIDAAEDDQPDSRTETGPSMPGAEKKSARRETSSLREPLAQELADLAETCPPGGQQLTLDASGDANAE